MTDWRDQLAKVNEGLLKQEKAVQEKKAAVTAAFRKRLSELDKVLKNAAEFGDAFGVDCTYEISRFDQRYPTLRFVIYKPSLEYVAECRDGVIYERLREERKPAVENEVAVELFAPRKFEQRVTEWVQAAAYANRKVPGKQR